MRKNTLRLLFLGLFGILLNSAVYAQFDSKTKGSYAIGNIFLEKPGRAGGWLQFEGSPETYIKTPLGHGERTFSRHGKFAIFPQKKGYQLQVQFMDETWGNWEIEDTFKKEGARIHLMNTTIDDGNQIVNLQRFLIQKAPQGYFIRTMDGRYLWYNYAKKAINHQPATTVNEGATPKCLGNTIMLKAKGRLPIRRMDKFVTHAETTTYT